MSASFFDLMKYARTGIASPDMTGFDKLRARAAFGGYPVSTITGVPPISFKADGKPLISWSMLGNGSQSGTPTPDAPIMPEFCGKLVGTDWTIPITNAGQTTPLYLGEVSTTRRVRKLVLTGKEGWARTVIERCYYINLAKGCPADYLKSNIITVICSHYEGQTNTSSGSNEVNEGCICFFTGGGYELYIRERTITTAADFKTYLQQQYAAGTPVTVWYVLAEPETAIVNEPLCKIGTYADELHSEDAAVTIPTVKGQNTLTVDTTLQPSAMSVTGHIKPS